MNIVCKVFIYGMVSVIPLFCITGPENMDLVILQAGGHRPQHRLWNPPLSHILTN